MSTKKDLQALDMETQYGFDNVKKDIIFLFNIVEAEKRASAERFNNFERALKRTIRELTRTHRKSAITGQLYPTIYGKVKALAEQAGIEFAVEPRVVTPTKVVAQKKVAVKKASK